ncbi:MAG: homoserine O-acetyltransferase [Saprospiraceae bacterium]|nr:homoserine O-acetyltransferase [Saprospiraceae bacterium]
MPLKIYHHTEPFALESGEIIDGLQIGFHTYGRPNSAGDNVIWVCHALTGDSDVAAWWPDLIGDGNLFDPSRYFIVCANNLGSCYGTTGPLTERRDTGCAFYNTFPAVSIRDMAACLQVLKEHLGIGRISVLIGGSQGGQIAQEWALSYPDLTDNLILLATNASHSTWGIAFNEAQRMAIKADSTFGLSVNDAGAEGLKAARSIALLSYRGYEAYRITQQRQRNAVGPSAAVTYQQYQGKKLADRFNAYSYVRLSEAMDGHDVRRGRSDDLKKVYSVVSYPCLVIGITSDILFPCLEQQEIAFAMPYGQYAEIASIYGHDGFLTEGKQISRIIADFLSTSNISGYIKFNAQYELVS